MNFKCYLCGGARHKVRARKDDIRFCCFNADKKVVECTGCGLTQLWPQWSEKELDDLYSRYWKKEDFKGQKRKVKISKYLTVFAKGKKRILEIGCGHGDNIMFLKSKGLDVTGIDKDPAVCDGKTVLNRDIKDYVPEQSPDMIYAIHLFEHIPNPGEFITWLDKNLEPCGTFVLEVPCVSDPLLSLYRIKEFSKFYWYPYHLFFYSPDTAKKMFKKFTGMKVDVKLRQEYGLINHLRWLLFRRPGNFNGSIPVIDTIYKFLLAKIIKCTDTMVISGKKV